MALTKVSGDFIKAGSITQGHLHSSHGITTSHIAEGDKLFFTNARVDSRVGSLSTSDLSEGTNLYYTDARARAAISGTGSLSYNSTTGVMSFTMPAQNTSNITEGSNLYYTDARVGSYLTTNSYATQSYVNTQVSNLVDSAPGTLDTLNELAAALGDDANFSTTVTNSIATKLPLAGGTLTGGLNGTTATFSGDIVGQDEIKSRGQIRATGWWGSNSSSENGHALEIGVSPSTSTEAYILSYNRNNSSYGDMNFEAVNFNFNESGGTTTINNNEIWHAGNDGSGSGLDADLLDGNHASAFANVNGSSTTNFDTRAIYPHEWIRMNGNSNHGIYWQNGTGADWHIYPKDQNDMRFRTGSANGGIVGTIGNETARGYIHWTTSNEIGFLDSGRSWSLRVDNSGNTFATSSHRAPIFYDSNNTSFYVDPASTSNINGLGMNGQLSMNGNNIIVFGPNSGWSKELAIGGDANNSNSNRGSIGVTNGNLHIDAADGGYTTYLNFYDGTGGVAFGSGATSAVAWMGPDGDLWKGSSDNSGSKYWHAGNDGSGSGLDADTLDGQHASAFLTSLPSHNHDDRYYTESETQTFFNRGYINKHGASNLAVGWYTIATNTGDRALGQFQIWDTAGGDHQSVLFNASHHFGMNSSNDITVTANSRYSGTNFRYIRIKEGSTYDGAVLQVYIDGSSNSVNAAIVGGNAQESGWVLKDWIADGTDPGDVSSYSSMTEKTIVDLDQVISGGMITTGPIYSGGQTAQYRVLNTSDEGSGNGLDADTLDGSHASAFWAKSGSWKGDLGSYSYTREIGLSMTGGSEFVVLSKSGQGSVLVDGHYMAYESNNGFFGSYNSAYGNLTGIRASAANTLKVMQLDGGNAILEVTQDARAPIFYDSNNTGYYIDPNTTGTSLNAAGSILGSNINTNIKYLGAGVNYDTNRTTKVTDGIALYSGYSTGANRPHTYDFSAQFVGNSRGFELSAAWHSQTALSIRTLRDCCSNWTSWYALAIYGLNPGSSAGALFGTQFYDSNNTGYYVNPAGYSNLSSGRIGSYLQIGTSGNTTQTPGINMGVGADMYWRQSTYSSNADVWIENEDATHVKWKIRVSSFDTTSWTDSIVIFNHNFWRGYVGILRSPEYPLDLNGQARLSGGYTTSDIRLKKNIRDNELGLSHLLQLRTRLFDWITDEEILGRTLAFQNSLLDCRGFIAQEVEEVVPELVDTSEGDQPTKSIDDGAVTAMMVKAIQEQQAIIDDLKARIEILENQ